jgi:hypothetical protein
MKNHSHQEPKSFIDKPLESKTRFIALSGGMVTGLLSEGSGARRCPGCGRWPVSRVWATHPNPAWRPKQSSLWPAIAPILHQTVLRAAPEPPRSLPVAPLIRIRGATGRLRWGSGGAMEVSAGGRGRYSTHYPEGRIMKILMTLSLAAAVVVLPTQTARPLPLTAFLTMSNRRCCGRSAHSTGCSSGSAALRWQI